MRRFRFVGFFFAVEWLAFCAAGVSFAQTFTNQHVKTLILLGGGTDLTHTLTLQAPTLSSSQTITLPGAPLVFPSANGTGVLTNDGLGTLSWTPPFTNPMTTIGDIIYASATSSPATPTRLGIGSNGQILTVTSGVPAWSTATYPATTTINQLLYSSAASTITGLSTANYGVLNTSSSGVPSISTAPVVSDVIQSGIISANTGGLALANSSSSHLTTIQAGNATAAVTYTLPTSDASSTGEALTSNGSGTLSWDTIGISVVSGQSNGSFTDAKFAYPAGMGTAAAALAFGTNEMIVTRPGTIKNLYIQVATAPASGKDYEIVIVKNGVASAIAADVTSGNTTAHDITHAITFAAGDLISVEMTHVTAAETAGKAIWAFELTYP